MKKNLGISLAVGLTGALWIFIADKFGLMSWPAFIGWTLFFYGGANTRAIKEGLPAMFLGVILAFLSVKLGGTFLGQGPLQYLPPFLLSFLMTYAQNIDFFKVCPATFLGSILYFSTSSFFYSLVISSIGVIGLGLLSVGLGKVFDKIIMAK